LGLVENPYLADKILVVSLGRHKLVSFA
jgi:hypothetical protein